MALVHAVWRLLYDITGAFIAGKVFTCIHASLQLESIRNNLVTATGMLLFITLIVMQ